MDKTLKNDSPVLLVIHLPQRETDWMLRQLSAIEGLSGRFWMQSLDECGHATNLHSTMEKVTGRAKTTRIQLASDESSARHFVRTLSERNHPEGISWMLLPILDQGSL